MKYPRFCHNNLYYLVSGTLTTINDVPSILLVMSHWWQDSMKFCLSQQPPIFLHISPCTWQFMMAKLASLPTNANLHAQNRTLEEELDSSRTMHSKRLNKCQLTEPWKKSLIKAGQSIQRGWTKANLQAQIKTLKEELGSSRQDNLLKEADLQAQYRILKEELKAGQSIKRGWTNANLQAHIKTLKEELGSSRVWV